MIVQTLTVISSSLDVDGHPKQGSLSTEVLPSKIDGTSQTLVYDPLHLHRMLAAIIDTFPLRFFPILKLNLMQMHCSVLSHIVKITMT